ncbi:MAG: glycosyltransferase [Paludibacter sp.]|nr:glycosyltransferase [Paludibacter sp.]
MNRCRILFISNLFPNPLEPHRAAFSRHQISALSEFATVDVIAPIAWTTRGRDRIPKSRSDLGCEIFYPTYWYTPGTLRSLYGKFFYYSIRAIATHLLSSRTYDFIYSTWLFPDGFAAARLAYDYNIPCFQNVVGTDVNRLLPDSPLTRHSLQVINQSQKIVAVSKALKQHLVKLGVDPAKIEVVYNGVDRTIFRIMDKQAIRSKLSLGDNKKYILFVGNLKKEKGLRELASAFAQLSSNKENGHISLVLIGSGPYEKEMRELLITGGVEQKVIFLGTRTQQEIAEWMNVCDVFCLPSYSEGQPNVVIEALACGARIVATNVGGIPELDRGQGGIRLVEPCSSDALAAALDEMLNAEIVTAECDFICSWQENAEQVFRIFEESGASDL